MNADDVRRLIDSTLLRPDATPDDVRRLCTEAVAHRFGCVCVNPCYVSLAAKVLEATDVKPSTVVGFPLGANHETVKAAEARRAVDEGAREIDMVMALGWFKAREIAKVRSDVEGVVAAAGARPVKVILETALLDAAAIERACRLVMETGAAFVKTSTGFGPGGATVEAVSLMRRVVGARLGVKASGGIRTAAQARALIEAGADRLGTSAGPAIIAGWDRCG